jgi:hypothetical protein
MEDKKGKFVTNQGAGTPGKPAKEVSAGLRKTPAVMNLGGNNATHSRKGTNRGTVSGSNPKHSPHVGTKGGR